MSDNKGWLSKEDFENLDDLFGKLGYGGYYDFLECLKTIGSEIGTVYFMEKGDLKAWDLQDVKTIPAMMALLSFWSRRVLEWTMKNRSLVEEELKNGTD